MYCDLILLGHFKQARHERIINKGLINEIPTPFFPFIERDCIH